MQVIEDEAASLESNEAFAESLASLTGVSIEEARERVARLRSPEYREARNEAAAQLGRDAVIVDIRRNEDGYVEVSVLPSPAGVREALGAEGKKSTPEVEMALAQKSMRRAVALFEVESAFGRPSLTSLTMLMSRGLFSPKVFYAALNVHRDEELKLQADIEAARRAREEAAAGAGQ